MLRESALAAGYEVRLDGIADRSVPVGVPAGYELMDFTTALVRRDRDGLASARRALAAAAGRLAVVGAAGVVGNFEMMNRLLDGIGAPVPAASRVLAAAAGLA